MDWREAGERLREQILAGVEMKYADRREHLGTPTRTLTILELAAHPPVDDSFVASAIAAEYHNDRSALIRYLSERPLGMQEQFALAQILKLKSPEAKKGGRPRERPTVVSEAVASAFYQNWRRINKRKGITDHGHRREMKDYSARFAVELACAYPENGPPFQSTRGGWMLCGI